MRYDLTVPFARYLSINKIKSFQIANVFRRDNPSFKTGRLREFIQADFDICGENLRMVNDIEVVKMIDEILRDLSKDIGKCNSEDSEKTLNEMIDSSLSLKEKDLFEIKINNRRILSGILRIAGVPSAQVPTICSTIDKFDKMSWNQLSDEFKSKGLKEKEISKISNFIQKKGTNEEILCFLEEQFNSFEASLNKDSDTNICVSDTNEVLSEIEMRQLREGIDEMKLLIEFSKLYKIKTIRLDLSLARGLDYYTGLIIEARFYDKEIGSIAGGGRYDNLCNSISSHSVPCVGFSIGISRVFGLFKNSKIERQVFVGSTYQLLLNERMILLNELWSNKIQADTFTGKRVNYNEQVTYAKKNSYKICIFIGEAELENSKLTVLDLRKNESKKEIERSEIFEFLKREL